MAFGEPGAWVQLAAVERESGELCGDRAVHVPAGQPATAEEWFKGECCTLRNFAILRTEWASRRTPRR